MPSSARLVAAATLSCFLSQHAAAQTASDLTVENVQGSVLAFLTGPVDVRHVEQLKEAVLDNPTPEPFYLVLNSQGGDVEAGIALGRLMRDLGLYAAVPEDAECLSSCAIILFGAEERILLGTLGIHRPYFDVSIGGVQPSSTDIQAMYDAVETYFADMDVPRSVFEEMMRIEPEDMRLFRRAGTTHEIASIMPRNDPVYAERRSNLLAARYGMDSITYRTAMANINRDCGPSSGDSGDVAMSNLAFVACQMSVLYDIDQGEAITRMQEASQVCPIPEEDMQETEILYYILLSDYFDGRPRNGYEMNRYFFFATHETQIKKDECYREILSR